MKKIFLIVVMLFSGLLISACARIYTEPPFLDYAIEERNMNPYTQYALTSETAVTKLIDDKYISSNILIENKKETSFFDSIFGSGGTLGSGVIFYETEAFYYALTNAHVVDGYEMSLNKLYVTDYYDNIYQAFVYQDSFQEDYDLAVVVFMKKDKELHIMEIRSSQLLWNQTVIAVGNPHGNRNVVTTGKYKGRDYQEFEDKDGNLKLHTYPFYIHNALIEPGNSGGMLTMKGMQSLEISL